MLSGYYTIASGMLTRQREIDVIGNNLTNLNTPGYRGETSITGSFEQELLKRTDENGKTTLYPSMDTVVTMEEIVTDFSEGNIKQTENPYDMSISGYGFFAVESEAGTVQLTRNGSFDMDEEGYLILTGHGRVQGSFGDILVGDANFRVTEVGGVFNSEGTFVGNIGVYNVPEGTELIRNEDGLFTANNMNIVAEPGSTVHQGSIETSNVDMNKEMSHLIEAQRAFQSTSSALQIIDSLNRKAITELGSIN